MIKNEFSDRATISSFLSPPRKPSNLKIQDISSTSTESSGDSSDSSDSSDSEEQSVANGTKDLSMQSDPSVNTNTLPDNHPIHLEAEARAFFQGQRAYIHHSEA